MMAFVSWTLWNAVIFQLLAGKATPKEIAQNSIRGRVRKSENNEKSEARINQGIRTTRTDNQFGRVVDRDLIEESETDSLEIEARNFPFLASLMDDAFNHICGGTFITRDMLLTAASCEKFA